MVWVDDSGTPWLEKRWDGTDWIITGSINATTNEYFPYIGSSVATAPESATGSFTYDLTTASGSQAITGVGFQPDLLFIFADLPSTLGGGSWGFASGTSEQNMSSNKSAAGTFTHAASRIVDMELAAGRQLASLSSMDADGFALAWVKSSSPTGTMTGAYLALKL